jgi:sterol desaturase/sphingolipid hydroxylase (fatty acid hydroxylase superfamily)
VKLGALLGPAEGVAGPDPSDVLPIDRLVEVATPYALAVNLPYVLALTAVAAEVAWLARGSGPSRRRVLLSAVTAAAMAAGALVVAVPYTVAFRFLWEAVATVRWEAAATFWLAHPVLGAIAAFVAWDLSGWVYHVIGHRTRIGWAAHQPHHSGPDFDLTLGLRQTWAPFHGLVHHPLLALAGFDLEVIFVCAAFSNCWQLLEHTSLPVRFPRWFSAVVMTPAAHRHHHRRDGAPVNLGPVLTVWDRLAGTWVSAEVPAPTAYGPAAPAPANPLRVELTGWLQLLQAPRPASEPRPSPA